MRQLPSSVRRPLPVLWAQLEHGRLQRGSRGGGCAPLVNLRILKCLSYLTTLAIVNTKRFSALLLVIDRINFLSICYRFKFTMGLLSAWLTSILVSLSTVCVKKTVLCDCLHLVQHWGKGGYCRTEGGGRFRAGINLTCLVAQIPCSLVLNTCRASSYKFSVIVR